MILYEPRTKYGKVEWTLVNFLLKVNGVWPMVENVSWAGYFSYRLLAVFLLGAYALDVEGQTQFILTHNDDLRKMTEVVCTTIIGIQYTARTIYNLIKSNDMRRFLEKFYNSIYIPK